MIMALMLLLPIIILFFSVINFIDGCGIKGLVVNDNKIKIAQILLVLLFGFCIGFEYYYYEQVFFSLVHWLVTMLLLFSYMIKMYGFYKLISILISLLEKNGYKQVSDEILKGYSIYGNNMPPRGFTKDLQAYKNALYSFNYLEIITDKELIDIQQKYRLIFLIKKILVSVIISWVITPVILIAITIIRL